MPTESFGVYGELIAPGTFSDLVLALEFISDFVGTGLWRGQSDIAWRIESALVRRVREHGVDVTNPPDEAAVVRAEQRLLEEARVTGLDRRDGRKLSDLELLAVLQHQGAATRLLDCTRNAFIALWFACEQPEKWGLLATFDLSAGRRVDVRERDMEIGALLSALTDPHGFAWWQPWRLSPRIPAQQAVFVLGGVVDRHWGSVDFRGEEIGLAGDIPGGMLLAISPELKCQLNGMFGTLFGYYDETLFPDLSGFARAHGVDQPFPSRAWTAG